jgi:hypothetical protein
MKKLLLFFVALAAVLWLLTSCDSFKKNDVNPTPTTEVVNKAVLDLVKLYYPNATDIVIKEIVKDRVWSVRFFVDNREIILNVDSNNQIIKTTTSLRESKLLLDKIITYIKANYSPIVNILMFNQLLDQNEKPTHYLAYLIGYNGNVMSQTQIKFDMDGNYVEGYKQPAKGTGPIISSQFQRNFDVFPTAIQQFLKERDFDKYKVMTDFADQYAEEGGNYKMQEYKYASSTVYFINLFRPFEKLKSTGVGRSSDMIWLRADGTVIEWYASRPNALRGTESKEMSEAEITPQMRAIIDNMLSTNAWQLNYGTKDYTWFTLYGQKLRIETKAEPGIYYDFYTFSDGALPASGIVTTIQKYKVLKAQENVPEFMAALLNAQLPNWKFISGNNYLGGIRYPSKQMFESETYSIQVKVNDDIYNVNADSKDKSKLSIYKSIR